MKKRPGSTYSKCPYCDTPFAVTPKRSATCRKCKRTAFVKSTPNDPRKRVVTAAEAQEADRLWERHRARQCSLQVIAPFGLGGVELDNWMALGHTEEKAVELILEGVSETSPRMHQRKMAYLERALRAHGRAEPFLHLLAEARRCELLYLKESGITQVEILTARERACPACAELEGSRWDLERALSEMPLPYTGCASKRGSDTSGFCGCMYVSDIRSRILT